MSLSIVYDQLNQTSIPNFEELVAEVPYETKYYAVYYGAYIISLIALSIVVDYLGLLDWKVRALGDNAHASFMLYEERRYRKPKISYTGLPDEGEKKGCCSSCCCCKPKAVQPEGEDGTKPVPKPPGMFCRVCCCKRDKIEYNKHFIDKLWNNAAYFGIRNRASSCCCCFTSGFYLDFCFYLCNHHTFLSMFMACRQSRFPRRERRLAYFIQHCVGFAAAAVVGTLDYPDLYKLVCNVVVVAPFTLAVNCYFHYSLACPCLQFNWKWCICKAWVCCLQCCGKLLALPMPFVALLCLLVAAAITPDERMGTVVTYAIQVHIASMVIEFLFATTRFRYHTYTEYRVCGMKVFTIGRWFKEEIKVFRLRPRKQFLVSTGCLCRFIPGLSVIKWTRMKGVVCPPPILAKKPVSDEEAQEDEEEESSLDEDGIEAEAEQALREVEEEEAAQQQGLISGLLRVGFSDLDDKEEDEEDDEEAQRRARKKKKKKKEKPPVKPQFSEKYVRATKPHADRAPLGSTNNGPTPGKATSMFPPPKMGTSVPFRPHKPAPASTLAMVPQMNPAGQDRVPRMADDDAISTDDDLPVLDDVEVPRVVPVPYFSKPGNSTGYFYNSNATAAYSFAAPRTVITIPVDVEVDPDGPESNTDDGRSSSAEIPLNYRRAAAPDLGATDNDDANAANLSVRASADDGPEGGDEQPESPSAPHAVENPTPAPESADVVDIRDDGSFSNID